MKPGSLCNSTSGAPNRSAFMLEEERNEKHETPQSLNTKLKDFFDAIPLEPLRDKGLLSSYVLAFEVKMDELPDEIRTAIENLAPLLAQAHITKNFRSFILSRILPSSYYEGRQSLGVWSERFLRLLDMDQPDGIVESKPVYEFHN